MGALYTKLVSGLLFPAHERLKGYTSVAIRRKMEQTQWWSGKALAELQASGLSSLLRHAQAYVPYYSNLFRERGIAAGDISDPEALQRIPFLTKDIIREHASNMKSLRSHGLRRCNTGGSSGEPLVFYIGKNRISHDIAAKWRATRWWGVDIGDPEIVVWGSPIELGAQDVLRRVRDRMLRTRLLSAFEMSEPRIEEFIRTIRRVRPRMIFGYPSAIAHIAAAAERQGVRLDDLGVRVVFVTAERLYEYQRVQLEQTFGCPVANGYGGRDAGFVAHQCPQGRMHLTAEDIIVEIVDNDGRVLSPGQPGEVVVTHLATADFPFIRYRTGDVAVLDDVACPCGRGLPTLREVQGRTTDFLIGSDGTVIHGLAIIYVLRDLEGIKNFKIIQDDLASIRILLVTDGRFDEEQKGVIERGVRARLGSDVSVVIERCSHIPHEVSGKYRYVVNHVAHTHQERF